MEHNNVPVLAKKSWKIVRIIYFMLRKSMSKKQLLHDLNLMISRSKIAGKAITNLMFHHHSANTPRRPDHHHLFFTSPHDYEFSCSNTPTNTSHFPFAFHFPSKHAHRRNSHIQSFFCGHAPPITSDDEVDSALKAVLEMVNNEAAVEASPMLPGFGFGRSPMVRPLRITDSPYPINWEGDSQVDKAAEEFIEKFYKNLEKQKSNADLGSS